MLIYSSSGCGWESTWVMRLLGKLPSHWSQSRLVIFYIHIKWYNLFKKKIVLTWLNLNQV
jgi:hypothetical protein